MKFHHILLSTTIAGGFIIAAMFFQYQRPVYETAGFHNDVQHIKATGKCVECHRRETSSIVHQFEISGHVRVGLNCLDCHRATNKQKNVQHKGFEISEKITAANCAACHKTEYEQFAKSRHGAPAWAAVRGKQDFSAEQIAHAEKYHPGTVLREHNKLSLLEPSGAIKKGCLGCHSIGRPNQDGTVGSCIECHSSHSTSVAMARKPETCAQCHMGPDHAQFEIFSESKHGALYSHLKNRINFNAPPKNVTTKDFPVPVCSTCHMSGLEGMKMTHDVTERLSLYLFKPVTDKRPNFQHGRDQMKETCLKCHASKKVEEFYRLGDQVVAGTNKVIEESQQIMKRLREKKLITPEPFDEPIEFLVFDIWHYFGRTAKHGAFMGGADFVQWHGNYELLAKMVELREQARELEEKH